MLDTTMSHVEVGQGDPVVFLHGYPTSSYLWRDIIPHVADHARYLDAWFEAVGAQQRVTLVVHDWESALGFHRAARHPEQIAAMASMEAIVAPRTWASMGPGGDLFRALRSPAGEESVLEGNAFVEQMLPGSVVRDLTEEEMAAHRAPRPAPTGTDHGLSPGRAPHRRRGGAGWAVARPCQPASALRHVLGA